jgi:hypothetical protein
MATITNEDGWVTISTDAGSGDTAVTATVNSGNSGRLTRSVTLKGTTAHDAEATCVITQTTKGEFVQFTSHTYSIGNSASSVTVTGRSNSQKLTFALVTSGVGITDYLILPTGGSYTVTAGGTTISCTNGTNITGDPGASAEYTFSITLTTHGTNPSVSRLQRLNVTSFSGETDYTDISQAGIATTILFDGYATGKVYDLTNTAVDGTQTINIGVTPSGEGWTLEFDE